MSLPLPPLPLPPVSGGALPMPGGLPLPFDLPLPMPGVDLPLPDLPLPPVPGDTKHVATASTGGAAGIASSGSVAAASASAPVPVWGGGGYVPLPRAKTVRRKRAAEQEQIDDRNTRKQTYKLNRRVRNTNCHALALCSGDDGLSE